MLPRLRACDSRAPSGAAARRPRSGAGSSALAHADAEQLHHLIPDIFEFLFGCIDDIRSDIAHFHLQAARAVLMNDAGACVCACARPSASARACAAERCGAG